MRPTQLFNLRKYDAGESPTNRCASPTDGKRSQEISLQVPNQEGIPHTIVASKTENFTT
jgi:hypothetical protein